MNMHPPDLPGTLTRQAGMQALEQAARTAADAKKALAVLTLDVDHFKPWHDEVGDTQSNAALARLVEVLKQALPAGTPVVHLGSDEFFVLLPNQDIASAQALAEQLRTAIAQGLVSFDASPPLSVTLGVAASPPQGSWTGQALLALADMRMTFAKRRLVPHHNLVWAGTLPSDWYARLDIDPARWPAL